MGTISVTNLGKAYKQYPTRWSRLAEWVLPFRHERHTLHWVLQDISFQLNAGEAVGILGVNGAGKSTLLKMITGTTQPTVGTVEIHGRVAALLELGMGFHPDFTGRQNVFMAGQLLGYSVEELGQLMPDIEAFANIGDYIDQPVRMYSSGMQMRLAFSVATAQRPEVLIVDEALAVGDAAFQRKCFQRIESFREQGTTLLLVSHDIETIKKLCDRALFIKEGRIAAWGKAKTVCDEYERFLFGGNKKLALNNEGQSEVSVDQTSYDPELKIESQIIYGSGGVLVKDAYLENSQSKRFNVIETGKSFFLKIKIEVDEFCIKRPCFNMQIKTTDGVVIFGVNTDHLKVNLDDSLPVGTYDICFALENPLAPGVYHITYGVKEDGISSDGFLVRVVDGLIIKVVDKPESTVARGFVDMRSSFIVNKVLS